MDSSFGKTERRYARTDQGALWTGHPHDCAPHWSL